MKHSLIFVLPGVAIAIATVFGSRAGANYREGEWRLRPTPFTHLFTCLLIGLLSIMLSAAWQGVAEDQRFYLYELLIAFGLIAVLWVCFWYFQVVYWNAEGIGVRGLIVPRSICWRDVVFAGQGWDGSFIVRSEDAKIRYTHFHGGYPELNLAIKQELPRFAANFR